MQTQYLHFGLLGGGFIDFPVQNMRQLNTEPKVDHMHPLAHDKVSSYKPHYFEDENYMTVDDVEQINTFQALYLQVGEVLMVRSANVPVMGDHFAIVSGPIENKEHGVRPQTISIATSPNGYQMLDLFEPLNGATLLKLKPRMRDKFHAFHNASVKNGNIDCLISKTA